MSQSAYTQDEILHQLDLCAADYTFPVLDNGYVYLADVRLSAYRTDQYWALVIEQLGTDYRAGGLFNALYRFGNCFVQTPGLANEDILAVMDSPDNYPIFPDEDHWDIRIKKGLLRVRNELISYDVSPDNLLAHGITEDEQDMEAVTITELVRSLVPEHHALLMATEDELRRALPPEIPLILRLDEWHHPDVIEAEIPSKNEAFQMIAEVLVSGDATKYKPTLPPNTHWSNWLESGTL